ncbi:sugar MFS transporter [Rapidithrix thailandica]|uniref:Sugar MFS transporter n=1 Tax=Rapidithrix thailandica TaxID=413964 RepID=A0AAW9RX49_9BACT
MWGFITCMNDILIPFVKKMFELSRVQSLLVQFAFFGAYFMGSLIYFLISSKKGDPISKIGYKNGLLIGLIVSALGCALLYPAAEIKIYGFFLGALFVLGLGFTMLQISANPYVAILGKPETASSRLNLSQAFNSFGTTIAPVIGGYLVFHFFATWGEPLLNKIGDPITTDDGGPMSALGVQLPYLIFAGIFLLLALLIKVTNLPRFTGEEQVVSGLGALKHSHLVLGMVAIFMYVGGEVSIGSVLINYMKEQVGFTERVASSYLAFYWGGAMIGRFLGAISLSDMASEGKRNLYMIGAAVASFLVIYGVVYIESGFEFELSQVYPYMLIMVVNFIGFKIGKGAPSRTLLVFSLAAIVLLCTTLATTGMLAIWTVIGIGLFNSIMWSNIFTLAIKDLGKYTSQGSSLLIMMILGGALMPLVQGSVADMLGGYHYSFFIPIISYVYLAFYGWKGHIVKKS